MYLFFSFLSVWMTKRKLSRNLNYFYSNRHFNNLFSKMKGRLRWHFHFWMEKCFRHFKGLASQIKYYGKSVIDYLKEEYFTTLFFLTENDSCDTFESKDDSSIKLLFAKEDCKWWKIHKKTFTIPCQWRPNNVKEEGFNSDILIIDSKTTE